MEKLPADLYLKIFCLLDHQDLAIAHQVCRKWKLMSSENVLWSNLFIERWGSDSASFYAPMDSKTWKDVYAVQDRCDRVGFGLKIIREGDNYYLIHQGEIQRHLGSKRPRMEPSNLLDSTEPEFISSVSEEPCFGILDKILFFLGDLETASSSAKRSRII